MGIAQIALDTPPPLSNGQSGKKVPQTILASLYTPSPPYRQKGAFLSLPDPILPNNGVIAKAMKKNHPHQQGEDATHVSKVAHPVCYRNNGWNKLGEAHHDRCRQEDQQQARGGQYLQGVHVVPEEDIFTVHLPDPNLLGVGVECNEEGGKSGQYNKKW